MWLHLNFNFGFNSYSMKENIQKLTIAVSSLVLAAGINTTVNANESEHNDLGPKITIPESSGEKCILPEAEMRRRHPDLLKHDRILTLREGVRAEDGKPLEGSLKQCVNCHATKDESNKYVRIDNDQHFCVSCHKYAAVSIDCFQCHRDIPEGSGEFHALTNHKDVNYSNVVPGTYSLTTDDVANIAPEVISDDN